MLWNMVIESIFLTHGCIIFTEVKRRYSCHIYHNSDYHLQIIIYPLNIQTLTCSRVLHYCHAISYECYWCVRDHTFVEQGHNLDTSEYI